MARPNLSHSPAGSKGRLDTGVALAAAARLMIDGKTARG